VDLRQSASFLGMTSDILRDKYGHHHPDFRHDAAAAPGRSSGADKQEHRETDVNERDENASDIKGRQKAYLVEHDARRRSAATASGPVTVTFPR
jgi:hypothetical protein